MKKIPENIVGSICLKYKRKSKETFGKWFIQAEEGGGTTFTQSQSRVHSKKVLEMGGFPCNTILFYDCPIMSSYDIKGMDRHDCSQI